MYSTVSVTAQLGLSGLYRSGSQQFWQIVRFSNQSHFILVCLGLVRLFVTVVNTCDTGCGGILNADITGDITSPGWPHSYAALSNCTWILRSSNPGDALLTADRLLLRVGMMVVMSIFLRGFINACSLIRALARRLVYIVLQSLFLLTYRRTIEYCKACAQLIRMCSILSYSTLERILETRMTRRW